ncbi:hypothetical protein B566_EDAN008108 [Ephemera danica]|nr:hypothetical protein B566_EDAN008108 [Ephemera danica]
MADDEDKRMTSSLTAIHFDIASLQTKIKYLEEQNAILRNASDFFSDEVDHLSVDLSMLDTSCEMVGSQKEDAKTSLAEAPLAEDAAPQPAVQLEEYPAIDEGTEEEKKPKDKKVEVSLPIDDDKAGHRGNRRWFCCS